jgi:hypothetical protein
MTTCFAPIPCVQQTPKNYVRFWSYSRKPLSPGGIHHSRRQLLANAAIAASRVGS